MKKIYTYSELAKMFLGRNPNPIKIILALNDLRERERYQVASKMVINKHRVHNN